VCQKEVTKEIIEFQEENTVKRWILISCVEAICTSEIQTESVGDICVESDWI